MAATVRGRRCGFLHPRTSPPRPVAISQPRSIALGWSPLSRDGASTDRLIVGLLVRSDGRIAEVECFPQLPFVQRVLLSELRERDFSRRAVWAAEALDQLSQRITGSLSEAILWATMRALTTAPR